MFMYTRTVIVNELLTKNVPLAIIESDAHWRGDVLGHINRLENMNILVYEISSSVLLSISPLSINADIISADNSKLEPSGGFIFFKPTDATRAFWRKLHLGHKKLLLELSVNSDGLDWGSEMKLLTTLWQKNDIPNIKLHLLSKVFFVAGSWYVCNHALWFRMYKI
jgi:Nucleotide-diphospho-sugar transferase